MSYDNSVITKKWSSDSENENKFKISENFQFLRFMHSFFKAEVKCANKSLETKSQSNVK